MSGINTGKVVVAGLLAGLLFNIGDFLIGAVILAADYRAGLERLGLDPAVLESAPVALSWIAVDFLLGLLVVWTYAAMRPRFGPGPKTALLAAFPLFASVTLVIFGFTMMGYFTMSIFVKNTLCSAVNVAIGALAGGWMYRES